MIKTQSKALTLFAGSPLLISILCLCLCLCFGASRVLAGSGGNSNSNSNSSLSFDYEALVALIQDRHLTQIEDVLPLLPVELRANYTLMHHSRSLQSSSFENPRAIFFGKDASLVCTFNGSSSQRGFDALECMQFRRASASFDFRQIQFPTTENQLKAVAFSTTGKSADGRISCSACHTADNRPNWLVYANWQGSYGANDDGLGKDLNSYLGFVSKRATHPRYRFLIQGALPTDPYIVRGNALENRPNLRLSDLLGRMNALRDAKILSRVTNRKNQLAFAFSALNCALEPADEAALRSKGYNVDLELDPDKILADLRMSPLSWSMRLGVDPRGESPYDHQSGFSFLNIDVAMQIVTEEAKVNANLTQGLLAIERYYAKNYPTGSLKATYQGEYLQILNSYVLDPDYFGAYDENKLPICRELSAMLKEAVLKEEMH